MSDPHQKGRGLRLFAPFRERKSAPPQSMSQAFMAFSGVARPAWTAKTYADLAAEGYERNPIVYRAVRMIAEAAATVTLVDTRCGDPDEPHPAFALLSMPNGHQSRSEFLDTLFSHLLVAGNAYIERIDEAGTPVALHLLRPDRITIQPGAEGWPSGYTCTVDGRVRAIGDPDRVLHLKMFAPRDDHYGLSPMAAAAPSLDIHNASGEWNKALLDNAARPSGALVYAADRGNLSDEQFDRLKAELEANFQGSANAGRPLLLEGGLDWKSLSMSPKDLDFIEAKDRAAREIALAFGVPPMLLGLPGDNTYANYREANRAFWRHTVIPLVERVTDSLSTWLGGLYSASPEIKPNLEEVEALAPEREAKWKRVMASDVLTPNEKREAVGYARIEGGDVAPFAREHTKAGGADG